MKELAANTLILVGDQKQPFTALVRPAHDTILAYPFHTTAIHSHGSRDTSKLGQNLFSIGNFNLHLRKAMLYKLAVPAGSLCCGYATSRTTNKLSYD